MKRSFITGLVLLVVFFAFNSCGSIQRTFVLDSSIPQEDLCEVHFVSAYIKYFNGFPVSGKSGWYEGMFGFDIIKIPAGNNILIGDFSYSLFIENAVYHVNDIEFSYNFEAGKRYTILLNRRGAIPGGQWGLEIYDGIYKSALGKDNYLLSTIPLDLKFK